MQRIRQDFCSSSISVFVVWTSCSAFISFVCSCFVCSVGIVVERAQILQCGAVAEMILILLQNEYKGNILDIFSLGIPVSLTSVCTMAGRWERRIRTVWNTSSTPSYCIRSSTMLSVMKTPVRPTPAEQCTVMGPSCPNCSLVLCTWPMKSIKPSPDLGTPCSGQSMNWNWRTVREEPSRASVTCEERKGRWNQ